MSKFTTQLSRFISEWTFTPITLQNLDYHDQSNLDNNLIQGKDEFVFFEILNDVKLPVGPGADTVSRQFGSIVLNVYTAIGTGAGAAQEHGDRFSAIYERKTLDGVRYRNLTTLPSFTERGWYVSPFVITFEHD